MDFQMMKQLSQSGPRGIVICQLCDSVDNKYECCELCKYKYCYNCIKRCNFCPKNFCVNCIKSCDKCDILSCCNVKCQNCKENCCKKCRNYCLKCNKTFCLNCIKDCKVCESCCEKCNVCSNCCCASKGCKGCKLKWCNDCKQDGEIFLRNCDKKDHKFCNECHFEKICVQCWNVNQYKFLHDIVKKSIINFLICMKITNKNFYVPKPIRHLILHYIVISKYKIIRDFEYQKFMSRGPKLPSFPTLDDSEQTLEQFMLSGSILSSTLDDSDETLEQLMSSGPKLSSFSTFFRSRHPELPFIN